MEINAEFSDHEDGTAFGIVSISSGTGNFVCKDFWLGK
jgi:hypothetical protein